MNAKKTLCALAGAAVLALASAPAASADYSFLGSWGSPDTVDVATSADGSRVYVLHGYGTPPDDSRGIEVRDADGHFVDRWGNTANQPTRFTQPRALERGADGKLYLLDGGDVDVIDPGSGAELHSFDVNGFFPVNPADLATAPDGTFYVFHPGYHNGDNHPDNRPPQVIHFAADGHELGRFGESGDGEGQFHLGAAQSIAVAPDGTVLVDDSLQKRIQRFTPEGKFRDTWSSLGSCPSGADDLLSAWDLAADPTGGAYITSFDNRVVHFGRDGVVDEEIGIRGDNPGQFQFPGTLDVGADGTLTVNDQYNDRVQRFRHVAGSAGCGGSPPPEPPASPEQPSSPSTPSTPSETPASPPQFGIVGVGDITAPSLGLTPYQRGGISAIGFEATCSEDCTITASPRATVEVGRRERTVEMPEVTQAVAAGTQQHVALKPSDELVAALYQALTTRGGDASVRVDLKAVDGAGNVRDGSVEIELGWGR